MDWNKIMENELEDLKRNLANASVNYLRARQDECDAGERKSLCSKAYTAAEEALEKFLKNNGIKEEPMTDSDFDFDKMISDTTMHVVDIWVEMLHGTYILKFKKNSEGPGLSVRISQACAEILIKELSESMDMDIENW